MPNQFFPGQVWTYQNRPEEAQSRVIIARIDTDDPEYGTIVHIYVSNLEIANPEAPGGKTSFIAHLPFEEGALEESVNEVESEMDVTELPDYYEGYRLWKRAFDNSEAGVFGSSVAEAIDGVAASIG